MYRFIAAYFKNHQLEINTQGSAWREITQAFSDQGYEGVSSEEVKKAVIQLEATLAGSTYSPVSGFTKRGAGSIGPVIDKYVSELIKQKKWKIDPQYMLNPSPEKIREVRINERAFDIFLQERYQHALLEAILQTL
jgi:hypothetical protein